VHTSTLTVAVLPEPSAVELRLREDELVWSTCRGSGAGGQHRNVTDSAVQVRHVPTGLLVRCEAERSQHQNRATALAWLRARLAAASAAAATDDRNAARRRMVGSGMRGDKRRTVRWQDGVVTDHVLDVRIALRDWLRGDFGPLAG
jgi:peptide chain release factor 1